MAENGEEKLVAVARHIAKTLGRNDTMADDILQIFSNFDGRLREKLQAKMADDEPRSNAVLEQTLNSLDRRISRYVSADRSIWSSSADSSAFLDAVDELVSAIHEWNLMAGEKPVAASLDRAEDLLQQAMFRLQGELKTLMEFGGEAFDLTRYRNGEPTNPNFSSDSEEVEEEDDAEIPVAHPISDYDIVIDALPSGIINDMHEIAKRMVVAGYEKECAHAYCSCRREFLEESLSRLGLHKLSIEEVQKMQWSDLEDEIERWIKAVNVTLHILLPSERRLCDRIFFGSTPDLSFMEVSRGSTIQLLNFAHAVANGSRAPERLFKVLDVYETIRDLLPEFEAVFSDQCSLFLRSDVMAIWKRLGEAIRGIFLELENLIRRDPAKAAVPGGGLHPITRYVMNYLRAACRSRQTLEQVYEESVIGSGDYRKSNYRSPSSSSLSVQIAWIMELLESNLESKSKIYKDSALCSIFMMNNERYIVQKVRDNELGSLLGDDWIREHTAKLKQYLVNYQRSSWSKVSRVIKIDSSSSSSINTGLKVMKEKLKLFNSSFEETCKAQSTWIVFDEQLKEELRISVVGNLLPAYSNFIGRLHSVPDNGKHSERYIKYSAEDIEAQINELFRGTGGSAGGEK